MGIFQENYLVITPFTFINISIRIDHLANTTSHTIFVVPFISCFFHRRFIFLIHFHPNKHAMPLFNSFSIKCSLRRRISSVGEELEELYCTFKCATIRICDPGSPSSHNPIGLLWCSICGVQVLHFASHFLVVGHSLLCCF